MIKFITRFLIALFFGIIISIWIAQNNPHVQKSLITNLILFLEKEWDARICVESNKMNFFTCSFFLQKGTITCLKKQTSWQFDDAKIHISLFDLIFKKKISLYLTFNNVQATTAYTQSQFDLVNHIFDIFATKSDNISVSPELIRINNIRVNTKLLDKNITTYAQGFFEIKKRTKETVVWESCLALTDGHITVDGLTIITNLTGTSNFDKQGPDTPWTITLDNQFAYAGFSSHKNFILTGTWDHRGKKLALKHVPKQVNITITSQATQTLPQANGLKIQGTASLPLIMNVQKNLSQPPTTAVLQQASANSHLDGACALDLIITGQENKNVPDISGTITLTNITYKKAPLGNCSFKNITFHDTALATNIVWQFSPNIKFTGKFDWDNEKNSGQLICTNATSLVPTPTQKATGGYNSWQIQPHDFVIKAALSKKDGYQGNYKLFVSNSLSDELLSFKGTCKVTSEKLSLQGTTKHGNYHLEAQLTPEPYITKLRYTVDDQHLISMNVKQKESKKLEGLIHYPLIQSWLSQNFKRIVLGRKNILQVAIDQTNLEHIFGTIKLHQGKFYIPDSRNLIEYFSTEYHVYPSLKKIAFTNAQFDFCKGTVVCPQAVFTFNDTYELKQMHAPLEINNLFINWKKDFYGFIYGNILFNKFPTKNTQIIGNLVLKKSLLRDNIFSSEISDNFYSSSNFFDGDYQNLDLNIRLSTEKPIKVKTSSLETSAHADIKLKYVHDKQAVQIPQIDGTINLEGGSLNFFRNKLLIEYGRIQFVANQMNDPLIDLIARNAINKYVVTLQATGSLQKPNIILESTPDLTEEQILGLLLTGSENATLQADLPVMLMQNLHTIILGSKNMLPKTTTFFEKISRPLKYVQITPNFTDQSGRGGIRGILSIDLNKQIHAQIQKNFNLQEDFAFQVEYLLSDDINLKVVKDQRGELGSEVEIKFKF